jgi:hypothetical protein
MLLRNSRVPVLLIVFPRLKVSNRKVKRLNPRARKLQIRNLKIRNFRVNQAPVNKLKIRVRPPAIAEFSSSPRKSKK